MAFGTPTDHFGIATTDLIVIDSSESPIAQSNADALDINGDITETAYFGNSSGTYKEVSSTYLLKTSTLDLSDLELGEIEAGVIATSINVTTSNDGEFPRVTVSGTLGADEITAPTDLTNKFPLPEITITANGYAQPMGFTVAEGELQSCTLDASCEYRVANDGAGEPAAFSVSGASATVTAEFVNTDTQPDWTLTLSGLTETQAPTNVEPQAGWDTSSASARVILSRDTVA